MGARLETNGAGVISLTPLRDVGFCSRVRRGFESAARVLAMVKMKQTWVILENKRSWRVVIGAPEAGQKRVGRPGSPHWTLIV
jgi:hypothetical protein